MDINNCGLALDVVTPEYEIASDSWLLWKRSRKPLNFVLVTRVGDLESKLIARVHVSQGMQRQKARHSWLRRLHKAADLNQVAAVKKFEVIDPELPLTTDLVEFVVGSLPQVWQSRIGTPLILVECHLGRSGLDEKNLSLSWTVLDSEGNQVERPSPDTAAAMSSARFAVRVVAEGGESRLPPRSPNASAYTKKVRPDLTSPPHYSPESLNDLVGRLDYLPDPRGKDPAFPKEALLAIICLARHVGSKSARGHCRWAALLSLAQRKALGLAETAEGQILIPSHDTIAKFIGAGRKSRQENCPAEESMMRFGYERPNDGDSRPVLVEGKVRGDFNDWLKDYGMDILESPLWVREEPKREKKASHPTGKRRETRSAIAHWSHVGDNIEPPASAKIALVWMTGDEISELSLYLESLFSKRDPRIAVHRTCPLRAVAFLLGLGRQYVSRKGFAVWKWSHRFDPEQLVRMGLYAESTDKRRPGPLYLERVIKDFGEANFATLDRGVVRWLEKKGKTQLLVEDGGKPRQPKRCYLGPHALKTGN